MSKETPHIVGLGNAIVDVVAAVDTAVIDRHGLTPGGMHLVDAGAAQALFDEVKNEHEVTQDQKEKRKAETEAEWESLLKEAAAMEAGAGMRAQGRPSHGPRACCRCRWTPPRSAHPPGRQRVSGVRTRGAGGAAPRRRSSCQSPSAPPSR